MLCAETKGSKLRPSLLFPPSLYEKLVSLSLPTHQWEWAGQNLPQYPCLIEQIPPNSPIEAVVIAAGGQIGAFDKQYAAQYAATTKEPFDPRK